MKGILTHSPFFKAGWNDPGCMYDDDHFVGVSLSSTADAAKYRITAPAGVGSVTLASNAVGGIISVVTDANAGDHASFRLNGEPFLIRPGYKAYFETKFKTSNIAAGFYVGFAEDNADPYGAAGAGPADGIGFIKDGTSTLKLLGRAASAGAGVTIPGVTWAAGTYYRLALEWDGERYFNAYVDGVKKLTVQNGTSGFTVPSATANLTLVCAAEATGAASRSVLNDRLMWYCEGVAE